MSMMKCLHIHINNHIKKTTFRLETNCWMSENLLAMMNCSMLRRSSYRWIVECLEVVSYL